MDHHWLGLQVFCTFLLVLCGCSEATESQGSKRAPVVLMLVETDPDPLIEISITFDASGYYLPNRPLKANGWTVDHLFIGHSTDFVMWRDSGEDPDEIPVWISLNPIGGETAVNALGQTYYPDARRLRPIRVIMRDDYFELYFADEATRRIELRGQIQPQYLQEPGSIPHTDAPALYVNAEMGGEDYRNLSFMHWLGD
jgi:hypothetical protein